MGGRGGVNDRGDSPSTPVVSPRKRHGRGGVNDRGDPPPTPVVSPRNRHTKECEDLLVPLLIDSRRMPTERKVGEGGDGVAHGLQRGGDDSATNAALVLAPAKEEDSDGWEIFGRKYAGSPPLSPAAWTPATGKRPLFSGGEV